MEYLLNIRQAATQLGVGRASIYRWLAAGDFPCRFNSPEAE